MATVPSQTVTAPPDEYAPVALLPVMVNAEKVTVPPLMQTPPPEGAVFPLMVHDEMATVPPWT